MKRIVFTRHAEEMLAVRGITKPMVSSCLMQPTRRVAARNDKQAYLIDFGTRYLKVIVADEKHSFVVVTLYWVAKYRVK